MKKERTQQVFEHFDREAAIFDANILNSVPHYQRMIRVLVEMLPFPRNRKVTLMDVGSGTGNIAYVLKEAFPKSDLVCLDLSPNMLKVAREKLKRFKGIEYIQANVADYRFDRKYDAIVSSLTLHHLETDTEKHRFHKKVHAALKPGGYFINADIIQAPDKKMQAVNLAKWKDFILLSSSAAFMKDRYKKYLAEDRPAVLLNELDSLRDARFHLVDVFWKYYNFAVYGGVR
jgi:tRNA (cmo5U34)-methyltransferase